MKNRGISVILLCLVVLCMPVAFCACKAEKIEHYSQKENYVEATGTLTHVKYNEDATALYLGFSDLSYKFDDTCFKIVGDNLRIAQDNGIDSKAILGKQMTFITAPRYFGDGYVMPIVAIYIDGECLLDFETGYDNLMKWLS